MRDGGKNIVVLALAGSLAMMAAIIMNCATIPCPPIVDLRGVDLSFSRDDDPVVTWLRYRVFLQQVVDGGNCDDWQLEKAVGVLEAVTGISSGLPMTGLGLVLDRQQLRNALGQWDGWFRQGNAVNLELVPQVILHLGEPSHSRMRHLPNLALQAPVGGRARNGQETSALAHRA